MEKLNPEDHAALLDQVARLPLEKAERIGKDLQLYLHKYQELLLDLEETIKNYKETARKIKGDN